MARRGRASTLRRLGRREWYLHLFDTSQPDLDWRNPEVPAMFEDVLRFWLDRGVDGFRVDVAHGLFKVKSLRDQRGVHPRPARPARATARSARWSSAPSATSRCGTSPRCTSVYRSWRRILEEYDGDRMAVAEAWTQTPESMARYVRPDELHQAFNFAWLLAPWSAAAFADVVRGTLEAVDLVGARADLGAVQPRRRPPPHAVRRRSARARPGAGRDADDAGAAGVGVPLPG